MSIRFLQNKNYDWEYLLKTYQKYVKSDSTVLEIGASTLSRTNQLAKYCQKLIGVELIANRIPKTNNKKIKYLVLDWQSLSKKIKENSIDLAISSHVIEHVPNDLKAINELYKVLKPKGIAIITTPNRLRLTRFLIEIFTGPRKFPWWEHVREYSYQDLKKLLKQSNFKKYIINPVAFGLHGGGRYKFYSTKVPQKLKNYANFWEIELFKNEN